MQILHTPSGDAVAVMKAGELILAEDALMHYVGARRGSSDLAVRMMQELTKANEQAERLAEEAAEGAEDMAQPDR